MSLGQLTTACRNVATVRTAPVSFIDVSVCVESNVGRRSTFGPEIQLLNSMVALARTPSEDAARVDVISGLVAH